MNLARRLWAFGDPAAPLPLLPLAAAFMLAAQLLRPVHDVDIFWQLKLGELTLAHGLPANEPFLAGREGEPLAVVAWLGQTTFAAARLLGGWPLLRLVDAGVWFGGFLVVALACGRRGANAVPAAAGLAVGWLAAAPHASLRPQSFAVLCFGLLIVLVRSQWRPWRKIAAVAALLVLWQNLHPSAAVGGGYLVAAAVGEWLAYSWNRGPRPDFARVALVPLAGLATLATPAGVGIYAISRENAARSMWLGVTEWLPIWDEFPNFGRDNGTAALVLTAVLLLLRGRRTRAADWLPMLALAAMACLSFRFILFWGVAAIPVWASCLTPIEPEPPREAGRKRRFAAWAAMGVATIVLALLLGSHFAPLLPVEAADALRASGVRGPVHCTYTWGGIVADTGYPDRQPTHDGRYYLYSKAELAAHFAAGRGEVPVAELVARYKPVAFFLRPETPNGLIALLRADAGWRELHADANAVVFVRR